MRRYWFPKPYADQAARLRVPFGFVLVVAFGWLSHPSVTSLAVGLPFSVLGLLLRGWAAGHLAKNQELARSGPYAFTRNPLYIGTLIVAAGLVAAGRNVALAVLFAAVFVLIYLPVIELEEQHLRNLFPAYEDFARDVPVLFPRFPGSREGSDAFRPALYWKNQEYQALIGFLAGAVFLIAKLAWTSR